jgi:hypothetical protein
MNMTMTAPQDLLASHLASDDDPDLWRAVTDCAFADFEKSPGILVEIGRCSHWLRPHQTRWTAGGGFAYPSGYGSGNGGGFSRLGLPQFDWSVLMSWTGEAWEVTTKRRSQVSLRITIPSRTTRHRQAAIHTLWSSGKSKLKRFYGFRKQDVGWCCVAVQL